MRNSWKRYLILSECYVYICVHKYIWATSWNNSMVQHGFVLKASCNKSKNKQISVLRELIVHYFFMTGRIVDYRVILLLFHSDV